MLEKHGIVVRRPRAAGRGWTYELTEKGRALGSVCEALGQWGERWLEIEPDHMKPAYVLLATTKLVDVDKLRDRTVVARVELLDAADVRYWMVLHRPSADLCTRPQGYVEDTVLRTSTACLIDIHLRRTTYAATQRRGDLTLEGPPQLTRGSMSWIGASPFAGVERP